MRYLRLTIIGTIFGIVLYKSQAVSWYRIFEMFHFDSFHMYGIIGSAVVTGAILVAWIKRLDVRARNSQPMDLTPKEKGIARYLIGGTIFGLGWALSGSCPGPVFVLIGTGSLAIVVVLIFALIGTLLYGLFKDKLPH